MPRPGVDVEVIETFEEGQAILDTSQGMFAGYTERGAPLTTVKNMTDYRALCGGRNGAALMYDSVGAFFAEGGKTAYIGRNATAAGVAAEGALGTFATFAAKSDGAWGNKVKATSIAPVGGGASAIRLKVEYDGTVVETSPNVASYDEAKAWANEKSSFVNVIAPLADSDDLPALNAVATLTTGADGAQAAADYQSGLDLFTFDLGPGQVNCPGEYDPTVHQMVGLHAENYHRCGVLDFENTSDPTDLLSAVSTLYGMPGDRLCIGFGTWVNYPGDAKGQINTIPFGGMEMGLIAKVDRMNDASLVAAGANAISKRALGLAQNYSDADRFALNAAGVSLGRYLYKNVRTYGYRTVAGPNETNWLFFQESRVIMNIAHAVQAQVEEYVFNSVDGRQTLFTRIKNACTGVLIPFFQAGALFGATPDQSFRVVCDARNNTDETIAAGEVHVTLYLRTSKVAEWIKVNIIKVPTDQEVPAA